MAKDKIDDFAETARALANDPRMAKAIAKRKAKRAKLLREMGIEDKEDHK